MGTYNSYLETEVLSADPVRLVQLLYRSAIASVRVSRDHLRAGEIRERSRLIGKALAIVHELFATLDHEKGGEIARRLAELYAYMATRLIEANSQKTDAPLAEVERLLGTLMEGWVS